MPEGVIKIRDFASKKNGRGSYKKYQRGKEKGKQKVSQSGTGKKRVVEELMDLDVDLSMKKVKKAEASTSGSATEFLEAGLSEQLRGNQ